MTTLGKILAFVNLVIAIAMLSWSVSTYSLRPGWFDAKPEGGYPTDREAENFALLKDEIDNLGRAAVAASTEWGAQRSRLEGLEKLRATRQKGYAERLEWARNGNPAKDGAAFFEPVYDSRGFLDLTVVGDPILGDDNQPLRGVNKLGTGVDADVREVDRLAKEVNKRRDEFKQIGTVILDTESRLLKMGVIRDSVQAELFHLASFEVNVYETRETVVRRKRQLAGRLTELGVKKEKE
jgi:hypothetical protein